MNKASNTITDVLEGVTLDLLSSAPGTVLDISITNDTAGVKTKIESFVSAYNSLMSDLRNFSSYDEENETAAPLLGDGFLSEIRSGLTGATLTRLSGLPSGTLYDSLAVIGIRSSTGGMLTINNTELNNALDDHFEDVVDLFTQTFSSTDGKIFFVSANEKSVSGEHALVVNYDASGNMTSATINGEAAIVEGKLIRGAEGTSVEGLVLGFTSPGSGPGTVNATFRFSQGAAGALWAEATRIQDPDSGPIHYATDGINSTIDSLNRQIESWESRLELIEERYRRQFTHLETLISQMRSQSNFLSSILG